MEKNSIKVLIVDDRLGTLRCLAHRIKGFSSLWVNDGYRGLEVLKENPGERWIVIVHQNSPGIGGGGFLHRARGISPHAAVLLMGPLHAFLYQNGGFFRFSGPDLARDIDAVLLKVAAGGAEQPAAKDERPVPALKDRFGRIIGKSPEINRIYRMIERMKDACATVLIQGESGTGKELVARTLHETGRRQAHPFVAVNCGTIPLGLMESELFGHERGAFTSAVAIKKGKFEIAEKGTLFLDEIGELTGAAQVKLLRVLQEKEFQRVGGNRTYMASVRIIAATNRDLKAAVSAGTFREDLFYRLNVLPVDLPPLRERRADIPLLLDHFLELAFREAGHDPPRISRNAMDRLVQYDYPGNVREMINIAQRLSVTCHGGRIGLADLPRELCGTVAAAPESILNALPDTGVRLEDMERELIFRTLEQTSGNKRAAAKALGITRRLLYLRLEKYRGNGKALPAADCVTSCYTERRGCDLG